MVQSHNLRQRHAEYYAQLLVRLNQSPSEQNDKTLTEELGNLRAALHWTIESQASESALRICIGMYGLWLKLGHLKEGQQRFIEALEIPSDDISLLRAHALYCAGVLSDWLGDYRAGQGLYRECLRIYEALQDRSGTANALLTLGSTLISQGDFEEGQTLSEQSLTLAREQQNSVGVALALNNNLGMLAIYRGTPDKRSPFTANTGPSGERWITSRAWRGHSPASAGPHCFRGIIPPRKS